MLHNVKKVDKFKFPLPFVRLIAFELINNVFYTFHSVQCINFAMENIIILKIYTSIKNITIPQRSVEHAAREPL